MFRCACLSFFVLMFITTLAPNGSSQALDGLWFKVTAKAKFRAVDNSGEISPGKGKVVAYILVQVDKPEPEGGVPVTAYSGTVFSEVVPDVWAPVTSISFLTLGEGEEVMVGPTLGADDGGISLPMALVNDAGEEGVSNYVRMTFTAFTKIKMNKEGVVTKASFTSSGAAMPEGSADGDMLFGGGKVVGKSIDPSKLPFIAPAIP